MKPILALLLSLALAACVNESGVVHDQHTGMTTVHSKRYSASAGLLHNTNAMAGYTNKNGYSVAVQHIQTGGSWYHFSQVWSYGRQFTFIPAQGQVAGCGGGCTLVEGGNIHMSEADFRTYAKTGFAFKMMGAGGAVEGTVPAEAFQEVLARRN